MLWKKTGGLFSLYELGLQQHYSIWKILHWLIVLGQLLLLKSEVRHKSRVARWMTCHFLTDPSSLQIMKKCKSVGKKGRWENWFKNIPNDADTFHGVTYRETYPGRLVASVRANGL